MQSEYFELNREFVFKWSIQNFQTAIQNDPECESFVSKTFTDNFNGSDIQFWMYLKCPTDPIIKDAEILVPSKHVSLYLNALTKQDNQNCVKVTTRVYKTDPDGEKIYPGTLINIALEKGANNVEESAVIISFVELFAPDSFYLQDDNSFCLECEINVKFTNTVTNSVIEQEQKVKESMLEMLHNAGSYYPDMEVVCEDGGIPCHSNILAVASPYFKALLDSGMKEKQSGKIPKKHMKKIDFMTLLEYIYSGKITNSKMSLAVYEEADQMNMLEFKDLCCQELIKKIDVDNCVEFLVVAERQSGDALKIATKNFIKDNYAKLTSKTQEDLWTHNDLVKELFTDLQEEHANAPPPPKRPRPQRGYFSISQYQ